MKLGLVMPGSEPAIRTLRHDPVIAVRLRHRIARSLDAVRREPAESSQGEDGTHDPIILVYPDRYKIAIVLIHRSRMIVPF
jgi:hypothetical protein